MVVSSLNQRLQKCLLFHLLRDFFVNCIAEILDRALPMTKNDW